MPAAATMTRYKVMQLGSPTGLYGAERWILALIRHLDPLVVESIVAVVRDEPNLTAPLCSEAKSAGFATHVVDAFGRVNLLAVQALRRLLVEGKVNILHTHGYKTDLLGLLATRGTSCRLVATPHGWSTRSGLKLRVYEALDRAIFPWFDAVVPLSDTLYAELESAQWLRARLHLIRNGVDIREIDASGVTTPSMRGWKKEGDFLIGYIGQLIQRKGLDVLVEAFARLELPGKRLVVVGDGPERKALEMLAINRGVGERVDFIGFRDDRVTFLKDFDVFALPSRMEGIPRCLMEALAARVPVVASNIPGCADLIEHGGTGLLFEVDDVDGLVAALKRLQDEKLRAALAKRGREHIVKHYSADAMAVQYQTLFRSILGVSG